MTVSAATAFEVGQDGGDDDDSLDLVSILN